MPEKTKYAVNRSPHFLNMTNQGLATVFYDADIEGLTMDVTKWSYSVGRTTVGIFIIPNQEVSLQVYEKKLEKFMTSALKFQQAIFLLSPLSQNNPEKVINGREKAKNAFSSRNCSIIEMMEVQADDAAILIYSSKTEPVVLLNGVLYSTKMTTIHGDLTAFGVNSILATVACHFEDPGQKVQRCLVCGAKHHPECQSHVPHAQP